MVDSVHKPPSPPGGDAGETLRERDLRFLVRTDPPRELDIVSSSGSYLFDSQGKRYIDFAMGWCVGNFGWDNR